MKLKQPELEYNAQEATNLGCVFAVVTLVLATGIGYLIFTLLT